MDKRDKIWSEYVKGMSEMEKNIAIINYYVYLKDDEHVNEFPLESYNILKRAIQFVEEQLKTNEYTAQEIFRYRSCIDDGCRVLNTSTVLQPLNLS